MVSGYEYPSCCLYTSLPEVKQPVAVRCEVVSGNVKFNGPKGVGSCMDCIVVAESR